MVGKSGLVRFLMVLALVLGAYVAAPAVDAVACAPEVPNVHAADHDHGAGEVDFHGVCAHGHCHHAGALKGEEPASAVRDRAASVALWPSRTLADRPSGGLDRPPRI